MTFRDLHYGAGPFVLPNAWDAGSALVLAQAGFAAIGTTSFGMSASEGRPDGTRASLERIAGIVRAIRFAGAWATADLEDGGSDDPERVADAVASLDVDGINLEDSTDYAVIDIAAMTDKIRAVKESAPAIFLNARLDGLFLDPAYPLDAVFERAAVYAEAGADGVFLHGSDDPAVIAAVASAAARPLNVLPHPTLGPAQLGELGVRRISTGSRLYRVAMHAALETAAAVSGGRELAPAMSYHDLQTSLTAHLSRSQESAHGHLE